MNGYQKVSSTATAHQAMVLITLKIFAVVSDRSPYLPQITFIRIGDGGQ